MNQRAYANHGSTRLCAAGERNIDVRFGALEHDVSDIRERLTRVETTLEHVSGTTSELARVVAELKHEISTQGIRAESIRSELIKWFVGTALVFATLAFTAAKYTH
jgi:chromosome segregation ATPase